MATNPSQSAQGANTNEALTGSESIKAYVRLKPFGADGSEELPVLDQVEQNKVIDKEHNQTYEFETVFGMQDNNQAVFDEVIGKNWELIRRGTKMAVFTYGQTSSGKTHTMKGDERDPGLIPRTLKKIFEVMDSKADKRYMVAKMSYFEIYNEGINDLLDGSKTNLDIRLDKEQNHHIPNLTWVEVSDFKYAMQHFEKGESQRKYATTQMNHNSSRSHVILQLDVEIRNQRTNMKSASSAILLADLAGSEGIDKTQTKGKNTLEGAKINTSLLSLSKVVKRLSQNEKYIGFRDSKLTMVLQPILIGNCMTSVICTVNTTKLTLAESINTLKFGTCAGVVQRKVDLSSLDKSLDNKIGKEVLQELDELNERYEEAQQQLSEKQQSLDLVSQEVHALKVQVDLLQNEKYSYLKEIDKLRLEMSKMTAESSKIAQMIDEMESKIVAEKEEQFKHMFDQQSLLIKNLEEEIDSLKSSKLDVDGRRPANTRDLAPCYKKAGGFSLSNSAEPQPIRTLMMDSMESIPEETEGLSKRHAEMIHRLREDNQAIREKMTQSQKENLRLSKINHLLRNDLEGMRKHIQELDDFARPRKNVKPVFAFDRNGDPVHSRIMASPTKEEFKKTLREVERKAKVVEQRLEEARQREDRYLQAIKQMALRQEELEHEAEMARQLEAQKLWEHINSQSNSKPEPPSGIFRPNRIMHEAKSLPVSPEDMQI